MSYALLLAIFDHLESAQLESSAVDDTIRGRINQLKSVHIIEAQCAPAGTMRR